MRKALVDKLVNEPVLLSTFEGRRHTDEIYIEPAKSTYSGPIGVLVDVLNASSAEEIGRLPRLCSRAHDNRTL